MNIDTYRYMYVYACVRACSMVWCGGSGGVCMRVCVRVRVCVRARVCGACIKALLFCN